MGSHLLFTLAREPTLPLVFTKFERFIVQNLCIRYEKKSDTHWHGTIVVGNQMALITGQKTQTYRRDSPEARNTSAAWRDSRVPYFCPFCSLAHWPHNPTPALHLFKDAPEAWLGRNWCGYDYYINMDLPANYVTMMLLRLNPFVPRDYLEVFKRRYLTFIYTLFGMARCSQRNGPQKRPYGSRHRLATSARKALDLCLFGTGPFTSCGEIT